jgi:2'-phosphotransferase
LTGSETSFFLVKMTAEVLAPMSALNLGQTVLPPSPISQKSPRHGRARGPSFAQKATRPSHRRGYSVQEDRETTVTKALTFVLKRAVPDAEESESDDERLTADADGWVDLDDVVSSAAESPCWQKGGANPCMTKLDHPHIKLLNVSLADIQITISSAAKARLALRQGPNTDDEDPASYQIRRIITAAPTDQDSKTSAASDVEDLNSDSPDLPEFVVFETSYARYPLILASGGIKRAGGQDKLSLAAVHVAENGAENGLGSDAEVSIFINLRAAMAAAPQVDWQRTAAGTIVTAGDAAGSLPLKLWSKAVGRRQDIGVLFEDGQVKKEIPVGLRGKSAKGKKEKGGVKRSMRKSVRGHGAEESSSDE